MQEERMQVEHQMRRDTLRQYVAAHGGPTSVAKALGYTNGSFLSQLVGPRPSKPFSEKVAREMESRLGLPSGHLDRGAKADTVWPQTIACVQIVASMAERTGTKVSPAQLATLVALAADHLEQDGSADERYIEQLLQLVK